MITTAGIATLIVIAMLGHAMAFLWYFANRNRWSICSRRIYDLPIHEKQIRRELKNSLHAPIHTVILGAFLYFGFFANRTASSFLLSALLTLVWAEIWHYGSHRTFHIESLHWIHREHHKSHVNSPFTAISFSFTEKLIFDIGLLGPLALLDRVFRMNAFGIAAWYIAYLMINSFSHANFELKSKSYNRSMGRLFTSTTYHSLHHSRYVNNYGLGTRVLDRLLGTEWDDYERLYDRIRTDGQPLARLSERVEPAGSIPAGTAFAEGR